MKERKRKKERKKERKEGRKEERKVGRKEGKKEERKKERRKQASILGTISSLYSEEVAKSFPTMNIEKVYLRLHFQLGNICAGIQ